MRRLLWDTRCISKAQMTSQGTHNDQDHGARARVERQWGDTYVSLGLELVVLFSGLLGLERELLGLLVQVVGTLQHAVELLLLLAGLLGQLPLLLGGLARALAQGRLLLVQAGFFELLLGLGKLLLELRLGLRVCAAVSVSSPVRLGRVRSVPPFLVLAMATMERMIAANVTGFGWPWPRKEDGVGSATK